MDRLFIKYYAMDTIDTVHCSKYNKQSTNWLCCLLTL